MLPEVKDSRKQGRQSARWLDGIYAIRNHLSQLKKFGIHELIELQRVISHSTVPNNMPRGHRGLFSVEINAQ